MFYNLIDGKTIISSEPLDNAENWIESEESNMIFIEWCLIKRVSDLERKNQLMESFITASVVDWFDWKWVELSWDDYNNLIILRNFEWDKWAQIARSMKKDIKDLYLMVKVLKIPIDVIHQIYGDDITLAENLSKTRIALWLSAIDLSFLKK